MCRGLVNLLSRSVNHGWAIPSTSDHLCVLSLSFCQAGAGTCPTYKRQVEASQDTGGGSNYSTAYFSLAKTAERADGYQTTVTGVRGGYHKPCPLTSYPPNEKQWADQRASYDSWQLLFAKL